ncbi:twin-arginine translocase subunit TatC, partial [Mesorhizobium sp. M2D.F.Ca.ET.140.01.1.1]
LYEVAIFSSRLIERNQERDRLARERKESASTVADKAPDASSS